MFLGDGCEEIDQQRIPQFFVFSHFPKRNMEKVRKQVMIKLTENEQKICLYLEKFIKDRGLDLTCRIAGGWVRDKVSTLRIL
jgi:hypothetical protein